VPRHLFAEIPKGAVHGIEFFATSKPQSLLQSLKEIAQLLLSSFSYFIIFDLKIVEYIGNVGGEVLVVGTTKLFR
jgi:hypothetical protein